MMCVKNVQFSFGLFFGCNYIYSNFLQLVPHKVHISSASGALKSSVLQQVTVKDLYEKQPVDCY